MANRNASVELVLTTKRRRVRVPVQRRLQWYDNYDEEFKTAVGGRLIYTYDRFEKRMKPKVVDDYQMQDIDNFPEIDDWVKHNSSDYGLTEIARTRSSITISVPSDASSDVEDDLTRFGISFYER